MTQHWELQFCFASTQLPYFIHQCNFLFFFLIHLNRYLWNWIKLRSFMCFLLQIFRDFVRPIFSWRIVPSNIWKRCYCCSLVCPLGIFKVQWNNQCWLFLFSDHASGLWCHFLEKACFCRFQIYLSSIIKNWYILKTKLQCPDYQSVILST